MASRLYEVLNDVENGRKTCISNARLAGYDVNDNATIEEIANLFTQEPTGEAQPNVWQRPSEWIDWDTLIDWDAPDENNLYPLVGLLMYDNSPEMKISSNTNGSSTERDMVKASSYCKIVTSDGSSYTPSTTTQIHTWDVSKDINTTTLPYKLRYVIIYGKTNTNPQINTTYNKNILEAYISNNSIGNSNCEIALTITSTSNITTSLQSIIVKKLQWYSPNSYSQVNTLRRYESYTNTLSTNNSYTYNEVSSCQNLEEIILHNAEILNNKFYNLNNLKKFSMPNFNGSLGTGVTNISLFGNQNTVFIPSTIKNAVIRTGISGGYDYITQRDFSDEQIITTPLTSLPTYISTKRLVLPNVTRLSSCNNYLNFEELITPVLQTAPYNFLNSNPRIEKYEFPSTFTGFSSMSSQGVGDSSAIKYIKLYNDWKIPMILTNAIYLSRTCLLDMLDKLADVTGESDTYTLTLGTVNLSKLTSAEIAVGTAKGWVIN